MPDVDEKVFRASCGIGLRAPHIDQILNERPPLGFLEIHMENYFGGGAKLKKLGRLRETYPLSFHGVGLSLGRADGLDLDHVAKIKCLVDRFEPALVSEHLSWSAYAHRHVPDLLALPYTDEALAVFVDHVSRFQDLLQRPILIENPSNYLAFKHLDYSEPEFLKEIAKRTGCRILLDINNIYVSAVNLGSDPLAYLIELSGFDRIGQFHLAGHHTVPEAGGYVLIDTHGDRVRDEVWDLYRQALLRFGDKPTLIEWDTDIPDLRVLQEEADKADRVRGATVTKDAVHV